MGILLAEVGGTKSEWWYAEKDGKEPRVLSTAGFHPLWEGNTLKSKLLPAVKNHIGDHRVDYIYYYGTGVANIDTQNEVIQSIRESLQVASVEVASDIIGAARAVSDGQRSIVSILGTGCNSGLFDGEAFEMNMPSLGLLAGDEGSGAHLGKLLIQAWMYQELSGQLSQSLEDFLGLDQPSFIHELYKTKAPGKLLAHLAYFVIERADQDEIRSLINQNFDIFIARILKKYPDAEQVNINFVGSFAWHFRDYLTERVTLSGLNMGTVLEKPGRSLLNHHLKKYK